MGSGFESQGAHFKKDPADSSESAGFLRSLNFIDFGLRSLGSALFLMVRAACFLRAYAGAPVTRTLRPSLLRCGERPCDTLRALPENAARYRRAAPAPLCGLWFRGSWNPAGSLGCAVVQCVRPVPSELGRGRAVACLVCCVVVGCFACGAGAIAFWSLARWLVNRAQRGRCRP